jgi:hypothetical protein
MQWCSQGGGGGGLGGGTVTQFQQKQKLTSKNSPHVPKLFSCKIKIRGEIVGGIYSEHCGPTT